MTVPHVRRSIFLLLLPLPVSAQETASSISIGTYLQAAFALAVIIALLLGTAWLARKVSGGKGFGHGGLRVLGGVALGPRERIVLVEAGESWLVVGIVPGQIRTLHVMPKGELPDQSTQGGETSFAHWLHTISERRKA